MLVGSILPPLLEALRPGETRTKLLTTTLKTLNQLVDAAAQEKPWPNISDTSSRMSLATAVNEALYTRGSIADLATILSQPAGTVHANQQISSTVSLIAKTCHEDRQRRTLVEAGVLDLLANKLVAVAVADESVQSAGAKMPGTEQLPQSCLSDVLDAIAVIIKDSNFFTARFLYSQSIQQLFGWPKDRTAAAHEDLAIARPSWDKLIPRVQTMTSKSDPYAKAWPVLGSYTAAGSEGFGRLPSVESLHQPTGRSAITDESESPLFIWLMYVARRGEARERLSACWLLAILKKFSERWPLNDPSKATREKHFSFLIIPLVVKMIEESSPTSEHAKKAYAAGPAAKEEMRLVLERSPLVLAELVVSNKALQSAAVDARILPTLVQILKRSFDTITTSSKPLWQPRASSHEVKDLTIDPGSSTLGKSGLSADVLHAFRSRESALLALAALAGDQDPLRKLIIEMGAATHIVEAMVPYTESDESGASPTAPKDGNPDAVLIAACKATRSLSRSVSVLRTSLIDHGVAQPVYELLDHPSVEVQIAATEVITNLVLELSPMRPVRSSSWRPWHVYREADHRQEIIEAGVLRALCEQCRSANFNLRFGSLWALKHLCLGLPQAMKVQCLDELGVGWLVQVLNGEPSKPAMGTPNAAGEQVDLLNAMDEPHMDVDEEASEDEEDEDTMADSIPSMSRHQRQGTRYTSANNIRDRLQQIRNDEQDTRVNGERDDMRLQEQALDFIRNFISEETSTGEMIEHLLKSFGHTRFFDLLDAKIRAKNTSSSTPSSQTSQAQPSGPTYWSNNPAAQRTTTTPSFPTPQPLNPAHYPASELVLATVYVLVHIANGRPSHRSLLISQTNLMSHVLPLLSHPRREIRAMCAWFLQNLLWQEDSSDEAATRERAGLLRGLGFEEGAKRLAMDGDQDVKERARTVVDMFGKLGEGSGGVGRGYGGYGQGGGMGGLGGWRHERG